MRALVIYNPVSGRGAAGVEAAQLAWRRLQEAGWKVELHPTTGEGDARRAAKAAGQGEFSLVVAVGGDGTLMEVAGGLVGRRLPLGIVPAGTGNAMAEELRLPPEPEEAVGLLVGEHRLEPVDCGRVGERVFLFRASAGYEAAVINSTEREAKSRVGGLAYVWEGLAKLSEPLEFEYRLTVDGRQATGRALSVLVANGGVVGSRHLRLHPDISVHDGRLDVVILRGGDRGDLLSLAAQIVAGRQPDASLLEILPAEVEVTVETRPAQPAQMDGEDISPTPFTVYVERAALRVLLPP